MQTLTATGFGLALLVTAIWVWARKGKGGNKAGVWMLAVVWLMLAAGMLFATGGRLLIDEGVELVETAAGPVLARVLGTSVAVVMFLIALVILFELAHVLFGKTKGGKVGSGKGGVRGFHPIMALFAGAFFLAAGGWFADGVRALVSTGTSWLG